jgi:hypothetical protein
LDPFKFSEMYVKSLEDRIQALDRKLDHRFDNLERKLEPLVQFKHEAIGRQMTTAGFIGFLTTLVVQFILVIFKSKNS